MSSREAARATRSMLASERRGRDLQARLLADGSFGKSSAGSTRRWKLELPLRISTSCSASRDSISTVGSASERATSASSRPGQQHRALVGDVGGEGRLQAHVEVGGGERHAAVGGGEEDSGESLGGGAGRNGSGDDRELGDEFFAFGRELQVLRCLLELD